MPHFSLSPIFCVGAVSFYSVNLKISFSAKRSRISFVERDYSSKELPSKCSEIGKPNYLLFESCPYLSEAPAIALIILKQKVQIQKTNLTFRSVFHTSLFSSLVHLVPQFFVPLYVTFMLVIKQSAHTAAPSPTCFFSF